MHHPVDMLSSLALVAAIVFPIYPGSTEFCSEHIMSPPRSGQPATSINWTAYHSADAPETVVAWYRKQLAEGFHKREGKADVWRMPADKPETVLDVTAVADAPSPIASCTKRPPATARTIILISTMTRHQAAPPPGQAQANAFRRSFPATGITKVVLRAADAGTATVTTRAAGTAIEIAGIPVGGAQGYHSSDPNWRETPAAKWGLDFVSERRGTTLVVSTKNEMRYIHHHYAFESLTVRVPKGVEVVKEPRTLTGDGAPDLR